MAESEGKRKRARVQLVEVLIGAVCAGGPRLLRVRSEFERMDAADGLKRLVLQAVDPELLAAVVGPRLSPVWVEPLRVQYARFKQAYPADWVDVEKVWREQRARWRRPEGAGAASAGPVSRGSGSSGSQGAARGYPARGVPGAGRAAPPRGGGRPSPVAPAARPASRESVVHRPVPAGVAAVHDPDVEPVVAPPDQVVSGEVAADVADADAAATDAADAARREARERDPAAKPALADAEAAGGSASGGGLNGASVDPPAPPRPAGAAERVPRRAADSAGDAHIVFSGKAGALVERFLGAMRDSRARVESVRRVWIDADGVSGGWDLWALDPVVIDRVPGLQRGVER